MNYLLIQTNGDRLEDLARADFVVFESYERFGLDEDLKKAAIALASRSDRPIVSEAASFVLVPLRDAVPLDYVISLQADALKTEEPE